MENNEIMNWSRVGKALLVAMLVACVSMVLTALTHLPFLLIYPFSAGFTAGHYTRLRPAEAASLGFVLALLVGMPLPVGYWGFGFLSQLAPIAIIFFSGIAAVYIGTIAAVIAWIGGSVALGDERKDTPATPESIPVAPEPSVQVNDPEEIGNPATAQLEGKPAPGVIH